MSSLRRTPIPHPIIACFPTPTIMSFVLPGELVPAKHVNLKLGPGLLQVSNVGQETVVVSTKAGEVKHSANNKQWWVESNARRVCFSLRVRNVLRIYALQCHAVRSCASRVSHRRGHRPQWRKLASRYRLRAHGLFGRTGIRGCDKTKQTKS